MACLPAWGQQSNIDTPNLDFSLGNFTGWRLYTGWFERDDNATYTDDEGVLHEVYYYDEWMPFSWDPAYEDLQIPRISRFQAINTHAADPVLSCYNTLYTTPEGYSSAGRIGGPTLAEGKTPEGVCTEHAAAEKMEYEFEITENTVLLTCQYACALQAPEAQGENHRGPRIPYFLMSISIVDPASGDVISKATCGEFVADADSTKTGIMTRNTNLCQLGSLQSMTRQSYYVYRDWTTEYIYLGDYIGQTARITLLTHDCLQGLGTGHPNAGSHEAYGYFRGETRGLALQPRACGDEDATITAPDIFESYQWSRSDNIPISVNPAHPNQVTIPRSSITEGVIYYCKVTKGCFTTTLQTEINPVVIHPGFTYAQQCMGEIAFTDTTSVDNDIITLMTWNYGDGSDIEYNPSVNHKHTYTEPGNYTVTLNIQTKTGCQMERNFLVNVKAFPAISIDADDPCSGAVNRLYLIGAGSMAHWKWYRKGVEMTGQNDHTYVDDIIVSDDGMTLYRIVATDAIGCEYTTQKEVTPKQLPSVYIQADPQVCFGDPITLTAISNANTYDWVSTNVHTKTLTTTPADTTTYQVIVTGTNNCQDTASWTVNVLDLPKLTITGNTTFCEGTTTQWIVSGARNYYWKNVLGDIISNTERLTLTSGGPYTVYASDAHNCKAQASKTAYTVPRPELSYSYDTACVGDNYTVRLEGAVSYQWSDGSTDEIRTDIVANNSIRTYTVIGQDGDCRSSMDVRLEYNALPRVSISGDNKICYGSPIPAVLTASGALRYRWEHGSIANPVQVSPSDNATYTVVGTDKNGCRGTASFDVTVLPLPSVSITGPDSTCFNTDARLTAHGAATYEWRTGETGAEYRTNNLTETQLFTVTGTDTYGCAAQASHRIIVKTKPTVTLTGVTEICEGETFRINATSSTATSYQWEENGNLLGARTSLYTHLADNNISLSLQGFLKGCPSDKIDTLLLVKRKPFVYINGPETICLGDTAHFYAHNAESYLWLHNSSVRDSLIVSPISATSYQYTLRGTTNGCSKDTTINLRVLPLPTFAVEGKTEYCLNEQIALTATSGEVYTYTWKNYGTGADFSTYPDSVGNTTYQVTATDLNQCSSSKPVTIRVKPIPDVQLTGVSEVCVGQYFRITANNAQAYTWHDGSHSESYSLRADNDTLVSVTGCSNGCCAQARLQLIAKPNPTVTINGKERICSGDEITLTASSLTEVSYEWAHGPTSASISDALYSDNTYRVRATALNGCSGEDTYTVHVDTLPNIRISGRSSMCFGESTDWVASGAQSYTWERGTNAEYAGELYPINTTSTRTYSVYGVDGNGCKNTAQKTITVIPLPVLTSSGNTIMCKGDTFHIAVQGADSYLWQNGNTETTFEYIARKDSLCSIVGTKNGCSSQLDIQLYALENPYVTITCSVPVICAGDTTTLEANGADTYRWFDESTDDYNIVTTKQNTTYTLTGYNIYNDYGGKQCKGTARYDLRVNPLPEVLIQGVDHLCEDAELTLSATGDPVQMYLWQDKVPGSERNFYNTQIDNGGIYEVKTYSVTGTDANNCSTTTYHEVTVYAYPDLGYIGRTDLCYGDSLLVTITGNADTYLWAHDGSTSDYLATIAQNITLYQVEGTLNGCTSQQDIPVTIRPLPIVLIDGVSEICAGNDITLTASGAATYLWSTYTHDTTAEITIRPHEATNTYSVTGFSEYNCQSSRTKQVEVHPLPRFRVDGDKNICFGGAATIEAIGNADHYTWSTGEVADIIHPVIDQTSTFQVTAVSEFNCTSESSWTVIPVEDPELDFGGEAVVCVGDTIHLIGQGATSYRWPDGSTGAEYTQVMKETTDIIMQGTKQNCTVSLPIHIEAMSTPNLMVSGPTAVCRNHEFTLTAAGAKTFRWNTGEQTADMTTSINVPSVFYVTGQSGNCTATTQVNVDLLPAPQTFLRLDDYSVCPGREDSVMLSATGATRYEWWAFPDNGVISATTSNQARATIPGPSWVYVMGYSSDGCEKKDSVYIGELPDPEFHFEVNPNWIEEGNTTIRLTGVEPNLGSTWYWNPGDHSAELVGQQLEYTYELDQVEEAFMVNVLAVDKYGCRFEGEAPVYAWKEFWMPNAFTPNDDGTNDVFRFFGGRYVTEFSYTIFNRTGDIIFQGNAMDDEWDGTFEGKKCPKGVYGWAASFKCDAYGLVKTGTRKGHVNLVR